MLQHKQCTAAYIVHTLPWLTALPVHPAGTGERNHFLPCAESDAHEGGMRLNRQR